MRSQILTESLRRETFALPTATPPTACGTRRDYARDADLCSIVTREFCLLNGGGRVAMAAAGGNDGGCGSCGTASGRTRQGRALDCGGSGRGGPLEPAPSAARIAHLRRARARASPPVSLVPPRSAQLLLSTGLRPGCLTCPGPKYRCRVASSDWMRAVRGIRHKMCSTRAHFVSSCSRCTDALAISGSRSSSPRYGQPMHCPQCGADRANRAVKAVKGRPERSWRAISPPKR